MGNQQNLGPRVAERVFEAVFPSIWAVGLHGVVACLASRKFRWVQFPHGPLGMVVQVSWDGVTGSHGRETVWSQFDSALGESLPKPELYRHDATGSVLPLQGRSWEFKSLCRYEKEVCISSRV